MPVFRMILYPLLDNRGNLSRVHIFRAVRERSGSFLICAKQRGDKYPVQQPHRIPFLHVLWKVQEIMSFKEPSRYVSDPGILRLLLALTGGRSKKCGNKTKGQRPLY